MTSDLERRVAALEARIERELGEADEKTPSPRGVSRRTILQALGVVGLGSYAVGTASADPQGQLGTDTDPVRSVHTEELAGGLTGGTAISNLLGTGLSVDDGTLGAAVADAENVGNGDGVYSGLSDGTLQFRSITAGNNVDLSRSGDEITVSATDSSTNNDGTNLGNGTGLYDGKSGSTLQFRSLVGGTNVGLSTANGEVTIDASGSGEENTASNVGSGDGVFKQKTGVDLEFKSLIGGSNLTITSNDNDLTLDAMDTDTQTDVSNGGTTVVSDAGDINFTATLSASADGDGTASVHGPWEDADTDDILEPHSSTTFKGIDVSGVSGHKVVSTWFGTEDAADVEFYVNDSLAGKIGAKGTDYNTDPTSGNIILGQYCSIGDSPSGVVAMGGGASTGAQDLDNVVYDDYGTVSGGGGNQAGSQDADSSTQVFATVGGGIMNTASGQDSTIAGGSNNVTSAYRTFVGGGRMNTVSVDYGTIGGGWHNEVQGLYGTIAGGAPSDTGDVAGTSNIVYDNYGTIGGGGNNQAGMTDSGTSGTYCTVGGGRSNGAYDDHCTVAGGSDNTAGSDNATVDGTGATVGGGGSNTASAIDSTIAGGGANTASGNNAAIGGGWHNEIQGNYGTIAGGAPSNSGDVTGTKNIVYDEYGTIGGGGNNRVGASDSGTTGSYCTVAGGQSNGAHDNHCTVAGGLQNTAGVDDTTNTDQTGAFVGGGYNNTASGTDAIIPGGSSNTASGIRSFAAGHQAKANDNGSFVWADNTNANFASDQAGTGSSPTGANTFHVRATGGLRLVTGLDGSNNPNAGQYLSAGGSSWQTVSARRAKHAITPVDPETVLEGVIDLDVSRWAYDSNPGVTRMGPMAGDFADTFDLGDDPETIGHVDADGVALAAIQGLSQKLEDKDERIDDLVTDLEQKDDRIDDLESDLEQKDDRIDRLEDRLGDLEAAVDGCN